MTGRTVRFIGDGNAVPAAERLRRGAGAILGALILWMLFSSRWGAYVGWPHTQFYLTDATLALVAILLIPTGSKLLSLSRPMARTFMGAAATALLGWAVVRFVVGWRADPVALRDFAPFLYVGVAVLAAASRGRLSSRWVTVALAAHVTWVLWALRGYESGIRLGPTSVFELRNDVDAGVCGIALAWSLLRVGRCRSVRCVGMYVMLGLSAGYAVMSLETRAGAIATLGCVAALGVRWGRRSLRATQRGRRWPIMIAASLGAVAVLVAAMAFTATGAKIVNTVTGSGDARGTVSARANVYELVVSYVIAKPDRFAFGVGFGTDFMHITGADALFEGTEYTGVRAPHDFALNTLTRMGLAGLVLELALVAAATMTALGRLTSTDPLRETTALAAMVAVVFPVLALFGVVLESPFGAVPYFWAVGVLAAEASTSRNRDAPAEEGLPARRSWRPADAR